MYIVSKFGRFPGYKKAKSAGNGPVREEESQRKAMRFSSERTGRAAKRVRGWEPDRLVRAGEVVSITLEGDGDGDEDDRWFGAGAKVMYSLRLVGGGRRRQMTSVVTSIVGLRCGFGLFDEGLLPSLGSSSSSDASASLGYNSV